MFQARFQWIDRFTYLSFDRAKTKRQYDVLVSISIWFNRKYGFDIRPTQNEQNERVRVVKSEWVGIYETFDGLVIISLMQCTRQE